MTSLFESVRKRMKVSLSTKEFAATEVDQCTRGLGLAVASSGESFHMTTAGCLIRRDSSRTVEVRGARNPKPTKTSQDKSLRRQRRRSRFCKVYVQAAAGQCARNPVQETTIQALTNHRLAGSSRSIKNFSTAGSALCSQGPEQAVENRACSCRKPVESSPTTQRSAIAATNPDAKSPRLTRIGLACTVQTRAGSSPHMQRFV